MKGFSFCYGCMRHHPKGLAGKLEHQFFKAFLSVQRILPEKRMLGAPGASKPGAPAILGRTTDGTLRPDEINLVKEIKLSLRLEEAAGKKLSPYHRRLYERHLNRLEKKYGTKSRFSRHREMEFAQPADLRRATRVFVGGGR